MRTRITAYDFGRIILEYYHIVYVIEYKKHWWSRWKIRDWSSKDIPRFYYSQEEARRHL